MTYSGRIILFLNIFILSGQVYANGNPPKIRKVIITTKNIFDAEIPGENRWWFRAANKLHFVTKEDVIKKELLLKEGDECDQRLVSESERNLRRNYDFLKEVRMRCIPIGNGMVDLIVDTSDTWTTQPKIDFGREGEEIFYLIGFEELNFAGRGKNLGLFHSRLGRRSQQEIRYADPQLFGTRVRTVTLFSRRDTGDQFGVELSKPFYAKHVLYAGNVSAVKQKYEREFLEDGNKLFNFYHDQRYFNLGGGVRVGDSANSISRLMADFEYREDIFESLNKVSPSYLKNRKIVSLGIGWSFIEEDFIRAHNVNKMQRTEDINLGRAVNIKFGHSPIYLGSDSDRFIFGFDGQKGFRLTENIFNLNGLGVEGRRSGREFENTLVYLNTNFVAKIDRAWLHSLVSRGEFVYGSHLDRENSVRLGGRSGLRGYRVDAFTGDRAILGNFEYRIVNPREFFHLFYFGGAVFSDIGTVGSNQRRIFSSVNSDFGLGLRILPSRASSGNPWRFDVSRQVRSGSQKEAWVISLFGGQAFNLFNNSLKETKKQPVDFLREGDSSLRHSTR